jgi:small subunit ribosomal protein S20
MRGAIKAFDQAVAQGSVEDATSAFRTASKIVDRTAAKGVIHANQASRRKSRMNARLKGMSGK